MEPLNHIHHHYAFYEAHASLVCTRQVFNRATRGSDWTYISYLDLFPVIRLRWPLHSSASVPRSGTTPAKWSQRWVHVLRARSPHARSSAVLHFIYCARLRLSPFSGEASLSPFPGARSSNKKMQPLPWSTPKTSEREIRQRVDTGTHSTGKHNPFIYLWVQVSHLDLQPACPFMHFLSHAY